MTFDPEQALWAADAVLEAYRYYDHPEGGPPRLDGYTVIDGDVSGWSRYIRAWEAGDIVAPTFMGYLAHPTAEDDPRPNVLALRGTRSLTEVWYDSKWRQVPLSLADKPFGKAAEGLCTFYLVENVPGRASMARYVEHQLSRLPEGRRRSPLVIAGHSLGGGLATLLAADVATSGRYQGKLQLYTFGGLHTGDPEFVTRFGRLIPAAWRIINLADFVPTFTGATDDTAGYSHVGTEVGFLTHRDTMWANHDMKLYRETLAHNPQYVTPGPRQYPNTGRRAMLPVGAIVMWHHQEIPEGWAACDGQAGRPDLRDRFIKAAGPKAPVGHTGGHSEIRLTVEQLPSHSHGIAEWTPFKRERGHTTTTLTQGIDGGSAAKTRAVGGGDPVPVEPPFYALQFIIRVAP